MSDTGGGHRAVAEAIAAAFAHEYDSRYHVQLLDAIKTCAAFPFNHMPGWYLPVVNLSARGWGFLFKSSNNRAVARLALILTRWFSARGFKKFFRDHSFDLVISVHPLLLTVPRRILRKMGARARFVSVVADLIDTHRLWFDPGVEACFVPTEVARQHARHYRVPAEKIFLSGLPVNLNFTHSRDDAPADKPAHRARLNLNPERVTVLLVGGGEGMGPVYSIARAIARARVPVQLVIIAGRNKNLYHQLAQTAWEIPVVVQGFVTNMPEWMRAADVLITKAGPVTISEALACGLPLILSGYLPGQESGNVDYVIENQIGVYCPTPKQIVHTLTEWLAPGNETLAQIAARARRIARPNAAVEIVRKLDEIMNNK